MGDQHFRTFMIGLGYKKYFIVVVEYSTKWVEAEPMATISKQKVELEFCSKINHKPFWNTFGTSGR